MKIFLGALAVIGGIILGFVYFVTQDFYSRPLQSKSEMVIFTVETGESFNEVARKLEEQKLVRSSHLLILSARLYKMRSKLKAGDYEISAAQSPREILAILSSGKSLLRTFTVSEGLNIYEVALNFEKAGYGNKAEFLEICHDKEFLRGILGDDVYSCEGYLFPETYSIEKKTSAKKLIEIMLRYFLKVYSEINQMHKMPGWGRKQIITLASIIEKETGQPQERPIISSVFHNRIRKKMKLQTDPTVLYGILDQTKVYPENITRKHLETPTRYNTYTNYGLPFGPIANPGREAILAVFNPAQTEYLFFVSRNDGTHVFTKTYEDHAREVRNFQLNPKAREGKSWRDAGKMKNGVSK